MPSAVVVSRTLKPSDLVSEQYPGVTRHVRASTGNDTNDGLSWDTAKKTIQAAVDECGTLDRVLIALGTYTENVTIPKSLTGVALIGLNPTARPGLVAATNGIALTVNANNVLLQNLVCVGNGTGGGAKVTGRRVYATNCKFQGGAYALDHTDGADGEEDASAGVYDGCEFAHATKGITLGSGFHGGVTQWACRRSKFHDLSDSAIESDAGADHLGLEVSDCVFDDVEAGTAPTAFILLNGASVNAGIVTRCSFPTALNGGLNLVDATVHWVSNYHTGGVSTGQPS